MGKDTGIAWCDHTANFWWGCFKVSDGCKFCYAETLAKRTGKDIWGPSATSNREVKKAIWWDIQKWDYEAGRDGVRRKVFVQSMSDFLEDHPQVHEWRERAKVFLSHLENLDVLLLTKRPENAPRFLADWMENWPAHIWMGTSTENQKMADLRVPLLLEIPAKIHFLSVEPMLGPVGLARIPDPLGPPLHIDGLRGYCHNGADTRIDWVIYGCESGTKRRHCNPDWIRDGLAQCRAAGVGAFVKQIEVNGQVSKDPAEWPEDLRVQQFP